MNPGQWKTSLRAPLIHDTTLYLLFVACLCSLATTLPVDGAPAVVLPPGTSNHGDPGLLCTPTTWKDIVTFFATNYLAHVATVKIVPGATLLATIWWGLAALILPYFGLFDGFKAIISYAIFCKTDLEMAARVGALCVVVRTDDWVPMEGSQKIRGVEIVPCDGSMQEGEG
jgi:hypothetical protein